MANPGEYLNRIWAIFRRAGITDDLTIIEYVAALLLEDNVSAILPDTRLRPRFPALPPQDLDGIRQALRSATDAAGGATILFDQFVVFRLSQMLPGGRYPTPRHIARTMVHLARVREGDSLADLACGSGGLLVAAAYAQPHVTGIEISPNWARLTWTNAVLHGLSGPDTRIGKTSPRTYSLDLFDDTLFEPSIYVGNAFSVLFDSHGVPEFDCIVMNPPFGETVDSSLVNKVFGDLKSTRSETLFTALALKKLQPGGHLDILLPTGFLFADSAGELAVRNMLLEDHNLEAIVSLPKDAFQPYSSIQTHLLVVRKSDGHKTAAKIWFYRVQHDGFTGGRNRLPDPEHDELPRLEATILAQAEASAQTIDLAEQQSRVGVLALHTKDSRLCGYRFEQTRETRSTFNLASLSDGKAKSAGLLATVHDSKLQGYLYVFGEELFSGPAETEPLDIDWKGPPDAHLDCIIADEDLAGLRLTLTQDSGKIESSKGKLQASINLRDAANASKPLAVIVDLEGTPLSPKLAIDRLDWLKHESPCAVPLEDEEEQPVGYLLIFAGSTLEGAQLLNSQGEQRFLVSLDSGYLLIAPYQADPPRMLVCTETQTFASDNLRAGVVVGTDGAWFGVAVPTEQILKTSTRDLQPSSYFPSEEQPQLLRSPAELLADIKTSHQELDQRLNFLLGLVEMKSLTGEHLPLPIARGVAPFCELSSTQQEAWRQIQALTDEVPLPDGEQYQTPRPFRIADISQDLPIADVQSALDLFERMGLILRVSIEGAPYYQHITENDLVTEGAEA